MLISDSVQQILGHRLLIGIIEQAYGRNKTGFRLFSEHDFVQKQKYATSMMFAPILKERCRKWEFVHNIVVTTYISLRRIDTNAIKDWRRYGSHIEVSEYVE